jgi:hypothetical protein
MRYGRKLMPFAVDIIPIRHYCNDTEARDARSSYSDR